MALLNVNVNELFEAESVVLQASLINGTATSKRWIVAYILFPRFEVYCTSACYFSLGGADFNYLIPSTLEFRSGGGTSTQVTVTIVDDNTVEMDEEFPVQISSMNPRVIVQESTANVTITDDDGESEKKLTIIVCYNDIAFSQLLNLALGLFLTVLLSQLVWLRLLWSNMIAPPSLSP